MYTYDENTFSDLHKEVYGFRPNTDMWKDWTSRTPRQKQELWNALSDELEELTRLTLLMVNLQDMHVTC
jgi:hypothetical protein